jgi:hypothetical protein
MPFVAQKQRRFLEAARRDRNEGQFYDDLREGLAAGSWNPTKDFRIRDLFENFVDGGHGIIQSWSPRSGGGQSGIKLIEENVNTGAFANIMGQIVYSRVLDAFNDPSFIGDRLVTTVPTEFDGEKIPGIGRLGDQAESIPEGQDYPMAGVGEEWITTPSTTKRGFIVPVTKEAIFFDKTGLVMERAREVTQWLAINKEKRIIDAAIGAVDLYRRNDAAAVATYGADAGAHTWENLVTTNALVDWTDIENSLLLFDGLLDPNTGEPIVVTPSQIIVPSALLFTSRRIFNATEISHQLVDNSVNANTLRTDTRSANPLAGLPLEILSNQWVKARTSSNSTWYHGDFRNAFWYMENWPITSQDAPPNSEMEFTNDIVARFKVSERGTVAVVEPRRAVKNTA